MACVLDFPADEAGAFAGAARRAINNRLRQHQDLRELEFWQLVAKVYIRGAPEKPLGLERNKVAPPRYSS